jgi:predicted P-loop ATPase
VTQPEDHREFILDAARLVHVEAPMFAAAAASALDVLRSPVAVAEPAAEHPFGGIVRDLTGKPSRSREARIDAAAAMVAARCWRVPAERRFALVGFDLAQRRNQHFAAVATPAGIDDAAVRKAAAWVVGAPNRYLALRGFAAEAKGRASADARLLNCYGFDADIRGEGHAGEGLFPSWSHAEAFLVELSRFLVPSVVLNTGGGIQFFFDLDCIVDADKLGHALLEAMQPLAAKHGGSLDSTYDGARVLRIDGGWRAKPSGGRTGEVFAARTGELVQIEALRLACARLEAEFAPKGQPAAPARRSARKPSGETVPTDASDIRLPFDAAQVVLKAVQRLGVETQRVGGVSKLRTCPACKGLQKDGAREEWTAYVSDSGWLRCFRNSCRLHSSMQPVHARDWAWEGFIPEGDDALREQLATLKRAWDRVPVEQEPSENDAFERDDAGRPKKNQRNAGEAMRLLGVRVEFDLFAQRALVHGLAGFGPRLDDAAISRLRFEFERRFGLLFSEEYLSSWLLDQARLKARHPVRDYLGGLRWDGSPRLDRWLVDYMGAADSALVREIGRLVLLGAVSRVRVPGCKFDEMLVLEGPQGGNKSSALAALVPVEEWFSDDLPLNGDSARSIEATNGRWIVEASELRGMRRGEVEALKGYLSRQVDVARLAYERLPTERPRQFVLVGTTNSDQYLRDGTGNRRFWPVAVGKVKLGELKRDRDQLWAEAAHRQAAGESIRMDPKFYEQAAEAQQERQVVDPWADVLGEALEGLDGRLATSDAWRIVGVPEQHRTQAQNERMGEAMRVLGFVRRKARMEGRLVWAYCRGAAERWLVVTGDAALRNIEVHAR